MVIPILLLISLGVVVISTSSQILSVQQAVFALIGLVCFIFIKNFDFKLLKSFIKPFYIIELSLLVLVFLLGIETRGSARWILFGPFNFQPSEFAKVVLILALALFWSLNIPTFKNIGKSFLILLPLDLLIFLQPDLGTALTLFFIWLVFLMVSNISLLKLLISIIGGVVIAPLGWLFLHDYQRQRILGFINPAKDPLGTGYNVIQATIAVGSGQLLGRGLGRGTQSRLQFLPEFRTDFIFAFIVEELGFIGSLVVLTLYFLIFYLCFKVLFLTQDRFGELIVIGVISLLFFQIMVNMGMNIGLLPITGITLPLLSYGGSSIITTFISLGFVESVKKFGAKRKEIEKFELLT